MNFFQRLFGRPKTPATAADGDYAEPSSGLVFPAEIGGLRRTAAGRPYAEGDRRGEAIPYGDDHAQATVYITTVGQGDFPDGGEGEFVRRELENAMAAVREMERLGRYRSVKLFAGEPERLGTAPDNLLWAKGAFFATTEDGGPMISLTYITALRSKVIKLRISSADPANEALKRFPHALGEVIGRQRR